MEKIFKNFPFVTSKKELFESVDISSAYFDELKKSGPLRLVVFVMAHKRGDKNIRSHTKINYEYLIISHNRKILHSLVKEWPNGG